MSGRRRSPCTYRAPTPPAAGGALAAAASPKVEGSYRARCASFTGEFFPDRRTPYHCRHDRGSLLWPSDIRFSDFRQTRNPYCAGMRSSMICGRYLTAPCAAISLSHLELFVLVVQISNIEFLAHDFPFHVTARFGDFSSGCRGDKRTKMICSFIPRFGKTHRSPK